MSEQDRTAGSSAIPPDKEDGEPINGEIDVIDLPDIPLPEEAKDEVIKDEADVALKYCFIGSGHAGSRIVESFYGLGYRRVCCVNTAIQDLELIQIPEKLKMRIGVKGAGKDPYLGAKAADENAEDILDMMEKSFGSEFDRIFVTISAGGGTGCGSCEKIVMLAKQLAQARKVEKDKTRVGVIVALPQNSEGQTPSANAHQLMLRLFQMVNDGTISPLVVIDNERIHAIYPGLSTATFWKKANKSIASLFHLFNVIAEKNSPYVVFDRADLENLLDSGAVTFGATPVLKPMDDRTNVSKAVRDNLSKNILSGGMDFSKGTVAGCIFIGPKAVMDELPQEHLDYGFETLTRVLADKSTVHHGIYAGSGDVLVVYTMIGGLSMPDERMTELEHIGRLSDHDLG